MTQHQSILEQLSSTGLSVTPSFLTPTQVNDTRQDLLALKKCGTFGQAGIGKGNQNQIQNQIRNNELCWLDRETANEVQKRLWNELDQLKQLFNENLFLGIQDFEGHYTCYSPGGFYQRHLDSFKSDQKRVVSFILYLNENWQADQGGELRVYFKNTHQDVAPQGGTLVCFMSRELEHEVLLSHSHRYSFTGWFRSN